MTTQNWLLDLCKRTANDSMLEEQEFEINEKKFKQEEVDSSISGILARQKQKEQIPKLLKDILN